MNSIRSAFNRHTGYASKYPFTSMLLLICAAVILWTSYQNHKLAHAAGYLTAVWLCSFLTDVVVAARPVAAIGFPIKQPLKKELFTIVICTLLGAAFLSIRFFSDWNHTPGIIKLALMPLILFTFPVVLAAIYLFRFKYKPKELGVNLHYWYLPLLLHIVWGGFTLWLAPAQSHWTQALGEYGIAGTLFTGLITASLPEEFSRLLMQTRFEAATKSTAFGMFLATVIWSAMHIPIGYGQTHEISLWGAVESTIYLVPIGMFWGYLTMRTGSMIPAIFMHGFNLWGLQNF